MKCFLLLVIIMLAVVILERATVPFVCMVGFKAGMGYSAVHMACVYKVLTVAAPVVGFCVCLGIEVELHISYFHSSAWPDCFSLDI